MYKKKEEKINGPNKKGGDMEFWLLAREGAAEGRGGAGGGGEAGQGRKRQQQKNGILRSRRPCVTPALNCYIDQDRRSCYSRPDLLPELSSVSLRHSSSLSSFK